LPDGTAPEVGLQARAVVERPAAEGDPYTAVLLELTARRIPDTRPTAMPPVVGCGTITALPDVPPIGTWTIDVPVAGSYDLAVTADTRIAPRGATPQVDEKACFKATQTAGGLVARTIELKPRSLARDTRPVRKVVLLGGTVVGLLPEDRSGDWTLIIANDKGDQTEIGVTSATRIVGEPADGVRVTVRATRMTDAAGVVTLVADKIVVRGHKDDV
jgi:hypothetical protein